MAQWSTPKPTFLILTHLNSFGVNNFLEIFMYGGTIRLRSMLRTSLDKFLKNYCYLDYEFISLCLFVCLFFFFLTIRYLYIMFCSMQKLRI